MAVDDRSPGGMFSTVSRCIPGMSKCSASMPAAWFLSRSMRATPPLLSCRFCPETGLPGSSRFHPWPFWFEVLLQMEMRLLVRNQPIEYRQHALAILINAIQIDAKRALEILRLYPFINDG